MESGVPPPSEAIGARQRVHRTGLGAGHHLVRSALGLTMGQLHLCHLRARALWCTSLNLGRDSLSNVSFLSD